jgi:hypothetical protein
MVQDFDSISLRLSGQRALLGQVTQNLRAVSVEVHSDTLIFQAVFDNDFSESDRELLSMAATEMLADCPSHFKIEERYIKLADPEAINNLEHLLFERYEAWRGYVD